MCSNCSLLQVEERGQVPFIKESGDCSPVFVTFPRAKTICEKITSGRIVLEPKLSISSTIFCEMPLLRKFFINFVIW